MEPTKQCTKCKRILPLSAFGWRDKSKGTLRSDCKECHSNYMKQKYQQKKNEIQELKSHLKCAKCGESRGYVLDFHHINPEEKTANISRLTSNTSNISRVYEEIQKCVVLCANCHREFHYFQERNEELTLQDYLSSN